MGGAIGGRFVALDQVTQLAVPKEQVNPLTSVRSRLELNVCGATSEEPMG